MIPQGERRPGPGVDLEGLAAAIARDDRRRARSRAARIALPAFLVGIVVGQVVAWLLGGAS